MRSWVQSLVKWEKGEGEWGEGRSEGGRRREEEEEEEATKAGGHPSGPPMH